MENLTIRFENECRTIFLEYLRQNAGSLRKLELWAAKFQTAVNWDFLANCCKLKEFSFTRKIYRYSPYVIEWDLKAAGVSFLKWLPPSVTNLRLQKVPYFWKLESDLQGNPIPEGQIISLLSRFPMNDSA